MHTALDIAQYFLYLDSARDGDGLSNLKIQKLVYYAQGVYCALHDTPLFKEPIEAWTHGPAVPELYHKFKKHSNNCVPCDSFFSTDTFNSEEASVIENIFDEFGQYTAWCLRDMAHEETPWKKHAHKAGVMPVDELSEYFKTRLDG